MWFHVHLNYRIHIYYNLACVLSTHEYNVLPRKKKLCTQFPSACTQQLKALIRSKSTTPSVGIYKWHFRALRAKAEAFILRRNGGWGERHLEWQLSDTWAGHAASRIVQRPSPGFCMGKSDSWQIGWNRAPKSTVHQVQCPCGGRGGGVRVGGSLRRPTGTRGIFIELAQKDLRWPSMIRTD